MKLISTNNYECVVASFAMVMDTTIEDLIERVGHNGKGVVAEGVSAPECWRSWHPEEFIDLLLADGFAMTLTTMNPMMIHGPKLINHAAFMGQDRFFSALLYGDGVIFGQAGANGRGHAVAWNRDELKIYDPRGRTYSWDNVEEFKPLQFYLLQRAT
jgi:hypothetical protein